MYDADWLKNRLLAKGSNEWHTVRNHGQVSMKVFGHLSPPFGCEFLVGVFSVNLSRV